jgi:hypothetical protein
MRDADTTGIGGNVAGVVNVTQARAVGAPSLPRILPGRCFYAAAASAERSIS